MTDSEFRELNGYSMFIKLKLYYHHMVGVALKWWGSATKTASGQLQLGADLKFAFSHSIEQEQCLDRVKASNYSRKSTRPCLLGTTSDHSWCSTGRAV
jgi:hypothetical protein